MERQNGYRRLPELDKAYRKRTYSLTTPASRGFHPSSGSQSFRRCHTASPKGIYPEDYRDVHIGNSGLQGDSGYMPMMPGVTPTGSKHDPYMPMSPMCVSAPKQIINPRSHSSAGLVPHTDSPGSVSLEDSGYMRMLCGTKMSVESTDGKLTNGEYLNMSPVDPLGSVTPPDYILSPSGGDTYPLHHHRQPYFYSSLPRSVKGQLQRSGSTDKDQLARVDGGLVQRNRVCRPTRLALESLQTLPCMSEHPLPSEPRSPGEYINIDFSSATRNQLACKESSESSLSFICEEGGSLPLSDYANVDVISPGHLGLHNSGASPPAGCLDHKPEVLSCPSVVKTHQNRQGCEKGEEKKSIERNTEERGMVEEYPLQQQVSQPAPVKDDYTEMTFSPPAPLPALCPPEDAPLPTSPTACVQRLSLDSSIMDGVPAVDSFLLGGPSLSGSLVDPHRGAKVIRADPQGRRRHSSETFSSTTTVTPVCPSFAHDTKRHSSASVENVSHTVCSSEGSDEDNSSNSPMCRDLSAGYQNGLNYIALNLMEGNLGGSRLGSCDGLLRFKTTACGCKGGMNGFNTSPYASMGFKETAAAVKEVWEVRGEEIKAEGSSHPSPLLPPVNVGFHCSQVTRSPQRQLDHVLQSMSFDLFTAFEVHMKIPRYTVTLFGLPAVSAYEHGIIVVLYQDTDSKSVDWLFIKFRWWKEFPWLQESTAHTPRHEVSYDSDFLNAKTTCPLPLAFLWFSHSLRMRKGGGGGRQLLFTEMSGMATETRGHSHSVRCVRNRPPSLVFRPELGFLSRLRPELNRVLSSSRGLVRGLPLAGLNSRGEEEHECALRGSGRTASESPSSGLSGGSWRLRARCLEPNISMYTSSSPWPRYRLSPSPCGTSTDAAFCNKPPNPQKPPARDRSAAHRPPLSAVRTACDERSVWPASHAPLRHEEEEERKRKRGEKDVKRTMGSKFSGGHTADQPQHLFLLVLLRATVAMNGQLETVVCLCLGRWTATVMGPQRSSRWRKELDPFFFKI
ncbi:hypothetical protein F7725_001988 [Dissostichus mawsoni]|uniref:Uncharacterized protein n=1 Tax=Dissostichus mawsoni TaxID=36200 RepID=A0A7J5Y2Y3_DISMA|nr:hypothetical protein F7725_001988 [Dissostichus mawsoni]